MAALKEAPWTNIRELVFLVIADLREMIVQMAIISILDQKAVLDQVIAVLLVSTSMHLASNAFRQQETPVDAPKAPTSTVGSLVVHLRTTEADRAARKGIITTPD